MRLRDGITEEEVLQYFSKVDKEYEESNDEYTLSCYNYSLELGHSRRGQHYYLLVRSLVEPKVLIYASEPDGSGGSLELSDTLFKLIENEIVVKD